MPAPTPMKIARPARPRWEGLMLGSTVGAARTMSIPPARPETKRHAKNQAKLSGKAQAKKARVASAIETIRSFEHDGRARRHRTSEKRAGEIARKVGRAEIGGGRRLKPVCADDGRQGWRIGETGKTNSDQARAKRAEKPQATTNVAAVEIAAPLWPTRSRSSLLAFCSRVANWPHSAAWGSFRRLRPKDRPLGPSFDK